MHTITNRDGHSGGRIAALVRVFWAALAVCLLPAAAHGQSTAIELEYFAKRAEVRGAIIGNPKGDIVVYEFFDQNCPYCRRAHSALLQLAQDYPRLKVVLIEYPILGEPSVEAAKATVNLPSGLYMKVHSAIVGGSGRASGERVRAELERLKATQEEPDEAARLSASAELARALALGRSLRISGVPGFHAQAGTRSGLDMAWVERIACGYAGRGSCNGYAVLLEDASLEQRMGGNKVAEDFLQRAVNDAARRNDPAIHNTVCWEGSLLGFGRSSLPACEAAVSQASQNPSYRDSRGLARALAGNRSGAMSDFQFFIENRQGSGESHDKAIALRKEIIERLTSPATINPDDLINMISG